jgi:hypothetical protein
MDKELERQMNEARANGYSEEQIQAFLNPQPVRETALPPATGPVKATDSPYVDRSEENLALAQGAAAQAAKYATIGGVGKVAVDTALKMAGKQPTPSITRGIGNLAQGAYNMVRPAPAVPPVAAAAEPLADFVQQRGAYAPQPAQAPVGGPAAAQGATFIERMAAMAGKYAPAARVATGVGAMVMPGNMGQNYGAQFPQSGPMRGSEINPATGRPWTPQELQQYSQQYR